MIQVTLGDAKGVREDISQLLGKRLKAKVLVKGDALIVTETSNGRQFSVKDVKLLVKHALHQLRLSEQYRVLAQHDEIRIVRVVEKAKPRKQKKGSVPPPSQSLPYFFP